MSIRYPFIMNLYLGFTDYAVGPVARAEIIGLANFERMFFNDDLFIKGLTNTFYYLAASVPLTVFLAFIIALLLNTEIRGVGIYRTIYYVPSVVPIVASSIIFLWMFNTRFGAINQFLVAVGATPVRWLSSPDWVIPAMVIVSLWGFGTQMVIFLAGLQSIPDHLYEAVDYLPADTGFFEPDSIGIQNTVIHELGHVLDFRSSSVNSTANDFALKVVKGTSVPPMGTPPYPDATDDIGTFWENTDATPFGERIADHFLNWVRNSYVGIEGKIDDYGEAVTEEQQRASAFWVGGIEFQENTSPGIEEFSDQATTVAEGAVDLLRSLGTGDPNPTCS